MQVHLLFECMLLTSSILHRVTARVQQREAVAAWVLSMWEMQVVNKLSWVFLYIDALQIKNAIQLSL